MEFCETWEQFPNSKMFIHVVKTVTRSHHLPLKPFKKQWLN